MMMFRLLLVFNLSFFHTRDFVFIDFSPWVLFVMMFLWFLFVMFLVIFLQLSFFDLKSGQETRKSGRAGERERRKVSFKSNVKGGWWWTKIGGLLKTFISLWLLVMLRLLLMMLIGFLLVMFSIILLLFSLFDWQDGEREREGGEVGRDGSKQSEPTLQDSQKVTQNLLSAHSFPHTQGKMGKLQHLWRRCQR